MTMQAVGDIHRAAVRSIEADIAAGKLREARAALDALRATAPEDVRICMADAMLARASADAGAEIAALRRVTRLAPVWPFAHLELAKALARDGQGEEAVAMADRAVTLAPRDLATIEVAVAVANETGDTAAAQRHLQTALALRPADISIGKALALSLSRQRLFVEAEPHWRRALAQYPDDPFVLGWLGASLIGLERRTEACPLLERAIELAPDNPALRFNLAIARGETPRTQPIELVERLFDDYAARFDRQLVEGLDYHVPEHVAAIVRERGLGPDASVLDLGCGTGLLGQQLGRVGGSFVGVDLSAKMLAQAARRGIYTQLHRRELLEQLRDTAQESFDYVVANDVFIYVGDLAEVIPEAFRILRRGGALIFSCETATESEGELALRPSGRYAHSARSAQELCRQAGFAHCVLEFLDLRREGKGMPVGGFIVTAQKTARD